MPLTQHDGVNGWIFDFVCPGNAVSKSHERLLLLKNATVNRIFLFDDVCKDKQVLVAYNNEIPIFEVSDTTGEMVTEPSSASPYIYWEWEIQVAFFANNNIKPIWLNAYYNWGRLNYTTGQWTGACGMIQRDEADYAIWGFSGTYARSKIAAFSATTYRPMHWLTRYPQELPPTWNLLKLFTKGYISQMSFKTEILFELIFN